MNFKMSENSLFAVLLRSPWYISMAIAFTFIGLSKALLPDAYWVYGALGSISFIVIGFMAMFKQRGQLSKSQIAEIAESVSVMSWKDFSAALEAAFIRDGYTVKKLDARDSADAADFLITRNARSGVVAAKRWKAAKIPTESLEALRALADRLEAADCVYIGTGLLGDAAGAVARSNNIKVMQADGLASLIGK